MRVRNVFTRWQAEKYFGCFNRLQPDTLCPREAGRQMGEGGGEGGLKVTYLIRPGPNQINLNPYGISSIWPSSAKRFSSASLPLSL